MKIDYKKAKKQLLSNDDIMIFCHRNPDGDTLGSGYGLCYALRSLGKKAKVVCFDKLPSKFEYLRDFDEEFTPKFFVSVDIASEGLFGEMPAKINLAIDHHPSNTLFAENTLLEPEAAATCEVIYKLIKELKVKITPQIATCLYTGIATDTGCFKFSNVTPETHFIAGELIKCGADFKKVNKEIFETKTMGLVSLEAEVLNNLKFFCDNKVALIAVTLQMLEKSGVMETELDGITGIPRQIEGVLVGVTVKQRTENEYKISVRSSESLDASEFCKRFGGGGHARAGGCSIFGTLEEVINTLTTALAEELE